MTRLRVRMQALPSLLAVALFALLFAAGSLAYEGFFSGQVFLNLFIDNAFLIVVALGMSFVILGGGIDLGVGAVVALATMVLAALVERLQWPPAAAVAVILLGGLAFGALQGVLVEVFEVPPFIATLAGMFLARGLCCLISIDSIAIRHPQPEAFSQARLMGLPVRRTRIAMYALCSRCAALGAIQTLIAFDGSLSSWWTRIAIGVLLGLFCVLQRLLEWWHQRGGGRAGNGDNAGPAGAT